jgi:hypothetical protein
MRHRILAGILLSLTAATANAALLGRAPATPGGTDYQAFYDDVLNITWLADANLAATNTFGVHGIGVRQASPADDAFRGVMNWFTAQFWISAMNTASYLGVNSWRLPVVTPINGANFDYSFRDDGSVDLGYNITAPGSTHPGSTASEMAHLYYNSLDNVGIVDANGIRTDCGYSYTPDCLTNVGPFANIQSQYWSGTDYPPYADVYAWDFDFRFGLQEASSKTYYSTPFPSDYTYAWPVSPGDLLAVPVPAVGWLLAPAFGLLGWLRRGGVASGKRRCPLWCPTHRRSR